MDKKWIYKHPTILFDFDNVLCDTTKHCLEYYNKIQGTGLKIEDIKSYDLSQYGDWKIFSKIFKSKEFWQTLPEKGNSFKILQEIINDGRYDCFIGTSTITNMEYFEKCKIIQSKISGFKMSKIIPIKDKSKFRAELIVDDYLGNLDECAPFMKCICMDMPFNETDKKYIHIHSLEELPDILEDLFY